MDGAQTIWILGVVTKLKGAHNVVSQPKSKGLLIPIHQHVLMALGNMKLEKDAIWQTDMIFISLMTIGCMEY